jgi:HSP20 family protein
MDSIRNIKLRWLHGTLGDVTYQLTRVQFARSVPARWQPAINAFRCESSVRICVDLAGVKRSEIDLTVEPRRVVVRGVRQVPEPHGEGRTVRLLALEIDYGPFEREVHLPAEIDVERASAEQQNGLLWIHLPLKQ